MKKILNYSFISLGIIFTSIACIDAAAKKEPIKKSKSVAKNTRHQIVKNPYPSKFLKDMNEQELNEMLHYAKKTKNNELVFKTFHYLITSSANQNSLKNYKIDLADFCFEIKDYPKASFTYEEFFILFPGSDEAEYAQYKSIICWFFMSLQPEKDQSNTHKTIALIEDFLRKAKDQKFITEVKTIFQKCRTRLFEHEVCVFEHYVKQKKWSSAQHRLTYIKEHFKDVKNIKAYTTYLEDTYNYLKNAKKPPFIITIDLNNALKSAPSTSSADKKQSIKNTAAYFLA